MDKKYCVWELTQKQQENFNSQPIVLPRGITTIGRGLGNSLQCPSSLASRNHCEIKLLDNGSIFIKDLKSLNGTFLDSTKILPERDISLTHGDVIGIGVETTDIETDGIFIFSLTQKVLDKDELVSRISDNCVVPLKGILCEYSTSSNHSVTSKKTNNDIQDSASVIVLYTESSIVENKAHLNIKDQGPSALSGSKKNNINIIGGLNDDVVSKQHSHISKTGFNQIFLENNDNNDLDSNNLLQHPYSTISNTKHGKTNSPLTSVEHNLTRTDQQSTLCLEKQTQGSESSSKTKQGVQCTEAKLLKPETDVNPGYEPCNLKNVVGEFQELDKNNSNNSLNTKTLPTHNFHTNPPSKDKTANDKGIGTKNELNYNFPDEKSSKVLNSKMKDIDASSLSINLSNQCFNADKSEIPSSNALKILETAKSKFVSNEHTDNNDFSFSIQQPSCSGLNENSLDQDSTVKRVFKRRLNQNSDPIVNVDNSPNPPDIKYMTSSIMERCIVDDSITLVDCDKEFSGSQKVIDKITKPQSLNNHNTSNSTGKVEPLVSDSFTIDDDIILIDDDDLLPCSQMFDIKNKAIENTSEDSNAPVVYVIDEDDISDADSSDEWFLRLSQCDPLNIKTEEDHEFDGENNKVNSLKSEVKESNIFDDKFTDEETIASKDSNSHIPLVLNMDVVPEEEFVPESDNVENNHAVKEKFEKADPALEQTFFDSNLNKTCSDSLNSKNKRKHEGSESTSVKLTTVNQHIVSKKMKQTHLNNLHQLPASEIDEIPNKVLSKGDAVINTKYSSNTHNGSLSQLSSSGEYPGKFQNKNNKMEIDYDEVVGKLILDCEHKSNEPLNVREVDLLKYTDPQKPAWKYLLEKIVMFSNDWDKVRVEKRDIWDEKILTPNTCMQLEERHNFQGKDHFEVTLIPKSLSVSNDTNTTSKETIHIPMGTSKEGKLISGAMSDCGPHKINKHVDSVSKRHSMQETKLDSIQKKISAKHRKKPTPIVGAKALQDKKEKLQSTGPKSNKHSELTRNEDEESKSKPWLSKGVKHKSKVLPLTADKKAHRKSKLSEIAIKTNTQQTNSTKMKMVKPLTNAVKITHKNRTDMFLDHLVSSGSSSKRERSVNANLEDKQKSSSCQYKIPRKNGIKDDRLEGETLNGEYRSKEFDGTMSVVNESNTMKTVKSGKITNAVQPKSITDLSKTKGSFDCDVEKLYETNDLACIRTESTSKSYTGIQNEHLHLGLESEIKDQSQHITSVIGQLKPIMKLPNSTLNNKTKKTVRFYHGHDNKLIVNTEYIEIAEGSSLKPITKHIYKKDTPPQRQGINNVLQMPFSSYFEETLHQICKWNTVWFQEKNNVKGEPPVFMGQIYHMKDSFINYRDYRRSIFPLMLYELWAVLARQHDQIQNRNRPFIIEIQRISFKLVTNIFFPIQKDGEKKVLCRLECQIFLDRSNQSLWPRTGDLVVLDVRMKSPKDDSFKRRILGYIFFCNIRTISSHSAISPKLKSKNVNASLVMDLSMYIREERNKIDTTQESRIAVLKNIRPEMRLFNALDCLSTSSMLNIVCQPCINSLDIPLRNSMEKSTCQIIEHLNKSQAKAVNNVASACLTNTNMVHFIHGPPGCGKSEVIISIIQMIFLAYVQKELDEPPQILLCAPSNAAIDDIFLRLMEQRNKFNKSFKNQKIKMVRIGRTDFTHKNVRSMTLDFLVEKDLKKRRDILDDEQSRLIELKTLEAKRNQLSYQLENLGSKRNDATYIRNVEMKLAETIKSMKELEKGKAQKALEGKELRERKKEREMLFLEGANIIASTLSSCYNAQMEAAQANKKLRLTCCIVDEATQCTEPDLLIPLMLGIRQLVLVGDPLQLPATVLSITAKEHGLDRSLFARHQDWWVRNNPDGLPKPQYHFLDTQYRMHPDIAKWPSQYFYKSSIKNHNSLDARGVSHPLLPYVILSHDFIQSNHDECNYEEVTLVELLVQVINASGLCTNRTIGIITPYSRQRDLLRTKLQADIEIGTVDSFQGRERDIIIMSCVRTEGVGFMSDMERLNVALTRARYSLIICGNFKSLQEDSTWASLLQDAKARAIFKIVVKPYSLQDLLNAISKSK